MIPDTKQKIERFLKASEAYGDAAQAFIVAERKMKENDKVIRDTMEELKKLAGEQTYWITLDDTRILTYNKENVLIHTAEKLK